MSESKNSGREADDPKTGGYAETLENSEDASEENTIDKGTVRIWRRIMLIVALALFLAVLAVAVSVGYVLQSV